MMEDFLKYDSWPTSIIPLPPMGIDLPAIPPHMLESWELFIGIPPPMPPCHKEMLSLLYYKKM